MKILISGDSFAADWTVKYQNLKGWPNWLSDVYCVTNIAQAGVSEYKIYQQIIKIPDIQEYDIVIISHTSPYRSVTRQHPVHHNDLLHKNADLMINDIEFHARSIKGWFNSRLRAAYAYMKYHYDIEYHENIYKMLRKEIDLHLSGVNTIIVNNFLCFVDSMVSKSIVDCKDIQKKHPGLMNHLSDQGNKIIFHQICQTIDQIICQKQ